MMTKKEKLAELAAARDEARLQLHLLSTQAHERWQELEAKLDCLERKISESEESAREAVLSRVKTLRQTVGEIFKTPGAELSTPVRSIMTERVRTCSPSDSLNEAARIFWEADCGGAPVVLPDGRVVGMITDRDVCMAGYTQGAPFAFSSVASAMSRQVYTCTPETSIAGVIELMRRHRVRRIPVTTPDGHLTGIVAFADIARWLHSLGKGRTAAACEAVTEALAAISESSATGELDASAAE